MCSVKQVLFAIASVLAALILTACATPGGGGTGEREIRSGIVEQINPAEMKSNHDVGVGAIIGGITGAGLGSLIGQGTGRDVAIAAGAIAGAVGGHVVQTKYEKPQQGQQVVVRLTSGVLVSVTQPVNPQLRTGMKVYVEGSGSDARVVPQ